MEIQNSSLEMTPATKALAFAAALFTTVFLMASAMVALTSGAGLGA